MSGQPQAKPSRMVRHCLLESTLKQVTGTASGLLVGWQASKGGETTVVDLLHLDATQPPSPAALEAVCHALPQGLAYVGVFAPSRQAAAALLSQPAVLQLLQPDSSAAGPTPAAPVLVATVSTDNSDYAWYDSRLGTWEGVSHVNQAVPRMEALAWPNQPVITCCVTLTMPLDVYTTATATPSSKPEALTTALKAAGNALCQTLQDSCGSFLVTCKGGKQVIVSGSTPGTLADLAPSTAQGVGTSAVTAQPLRTPTTTGSGPATEALGASEPAAGPVYEYQVASAGSLSHQRSTLHLSALAYAPASTPLAALGRTLLLPALVRLAGAATGMMGARGQVQDAAAHHFLPPGRSHHVTLVYPRLPATGMDTLEASLAPLRSELHRLLALPSDRPCLRLGNAIPVRAEGREAGGAAGQAAAAQRLRDVHLGLTQPVAGGAVSLVDGSYDYHHYMQDRFNDSGWGCAYRSLQTIVSWFRLQQYTAKPVPSHREIQQLLVRIGDKASDFIGSSNWIGAIELSYILDEYLGITSKIITVNKGSDIPSHARQLAAHFATQGTPVMIGGGVLAYTLLGVSFNEVTGDCAFLILDPHYTGGEDLKKIHGGTWVAWKKPGDTAAAGGPLFVQDAFYNFLCPQRPQQV